MYLAWFDKQFRKDNAAQRGPVRTSVMRAGCTSRGSPDNGTHVAWRFGRVVALVNCEWMTPHRTLALAMARKQQRQIADALRLIAVARSGKRSTPRVAAQEDRAVKASNSPANRGFVARCEGTGEGTSCARMVIADTSEQQPAVARGRVRARAGARACARASGSRRRGVARTQRRRARTRPAAAGRGARASSANTARSKPRSFSAASSQSRSSP